MKKARRKPAERFSADRLMLNVARTLIQDFRRNLDDPLFASDHLSKVQTGDVKEIRASLPALDYEGDAYRFKATYQICDLMKRHRFEKDLFSDQDLETEAIAKFRKVQSHLATIDLGCVSATASRILDYAAWYIRKLLGTYDPDEHRELCRFGKRASVGIPARAACLAARWELPLTGSQEQISWFDAEMRDVACVQEYWIRQLDSDPNRSNYRLTSSLRLALVPKTFKSLRSIMPNTTIGGYMSYGLGMMMRKRLKKKGYDISTLQMRHRQLASRGSIHSMYTTADLSSASDTISCDLVDRLFPEDWREILWKSRIGTVELPDGSFVESQTFCTMGIGFTFPLQTLVFLALLKALHYHFYGKRRCTISVYGDDMIYPSYLHDQVVTLFSEIGFLLNESKTFSTGHFRESCGGDYFRGVDVRPFQPRNGSQMHLGKRAYEAVLYKYINNLLVRWTEYEIHETLGYLLSEVCRCSGTAKIVPGDFPDEAGVKCPTLGCWNFLSNRSDVASPKHVGNGVFRFSYLRFEPEKREERRHEPYLWEVLRGKESVPEGYAFHSPVPRPVGVQDLLQKILNLDESSPELQWEKTDQLVRLSNGQREHRLLPVVTVSHTGAYTRQHGFSCFGNRR